MKRGLWVLALAAATVVGCGDADAVPGRSGGTASADSALRTRSEELLPDVERLSGLPAREPLNFGLRSRESLERFLKNELDEQFADEHLGSLVRVYARLGLVPDTLDLQPLLTRLLMEQIVGFYDPASDTLFVMEGVDDQLVEGVLVHEMVHALQDQYVDLDSLVEASRHRNDEGMAVQAAIEGHATMVMYEWMLKQMTGRDVDLSSLPRLSEQFDMDALGSAGIEMPELEQAPAIIREQLLFPYVAGLDFLQVRWGSPAGRVPPLGDAMPHTTEQILHPGRWGAPETAVPPPLTFAGALPPGWEEVYRDGMGEEDTRVFLREFLDDRGRADAAARGWDGDVYRLVEGPHGEVLVWVSRWDAPREADEFAASARRAFAARYAGDEGRRVAVERIGEREVRVVDRPAAEGALPDGLLAVDG
ncbi:MAG: hypothetical protein PVF05_10665 [Gemmatimonadales bacterium]|jgi:hypothetical protein